MKKDNKDMQILKEEMWSRRTTAEITIIGKKTTTEEYDILREIQKSNMREKEVIQALGKQDRLIWKENGVVYMERRIYVPNNKKIREKILKENHDLVDMGHPGQHRILELLKRTYWWPELKEDIK